MEGLGEGEDIGMHIISVHTTNIIVQNNRTRESSVAISPSWQMLEEIEFHRLAKLRLEMDEPDELCVLPTPSPVSLLLIIL